MAALGCTPITREHNGADKHFRAAVHWADKRTGGSAARSDQRKERARAVPLTPLSVGPAPPRRGFSLLFPALLRAKGSEFELEVTIE